jgi:hypothetical protein
MPPLRTCKNADFTGSVASQWGEMYRGLSSDEGPDDVFENDSGEKNHYVTL